MSSLLRTKPNHPSGGTNQQPTSTKDQSAWAERFAKRTGLMKRTAVRELLKVISRPEIISFAGGLPAAELFPLGRVQEAVAAVFKREGGQSLQYGESEGLTGLRDWVARKFSRGNL